MVVFPVFVTLITGFAVEAQLTGEGLAKLFKVKLVTGILSIDTLSKYKLLPQAFTPSKAI